MSITLTATLRTVQERTLELRLRNTTVAVTNNLAVAGVSLEAWVGRHCLSLPLATAFYVN
jgi:hypothetical protein